MNFTKILISILLVTGLYAQCDWNGDGNVDVVDVVSTVDCILTQCWNPTAPDHPFEMVTVPAGAFSYGEEGVLQTIPYDYEIMKYEVTNQLYVDFLTMANNEGLLYVTTATVYGYYTGDEHWVADNYEYLDLDDVDCRIHWNGFSFLIDPGYEHHPVVEVTWFGAWGMADYYSLRLPSGPEWEKAARGCCDGRFYPWGNEDPDCDIHVENGAKFDDNGLCNSTGTEMVGSFYNSIGPYGTFDQAGNVWEWTSDWFEEGLSYRVLRGGSFKGGKATLKSFVRLNNYPAGSLDRFGFRLAGTPEN